MKKWIVGIVIVLLVALAVVYIMIPSRLDASGKRVIQGPAKAILRNEFQEVNWSHWWPGKEVSHPNIPGNLAEFNWNGRTWRIMDRQINSLLLMVINGNDSVELSIGFLLQQLTDTQVSWSLLSRQSINPLARIRQYLVFEKIKKDVDHLVDLMEQFYGNEDRVYENKVIIESLQDTLLISFARETDRYPDQAVLDSMINRLDDYALGHQARQPGPAMLNISNEEGRGRFQVRVAVPVLKPLTQMNDIATKRMPANVLMMTTEVRGGQATAQRAMETVDAYATDHGYKLPAIPYFSLITDRRSEPDTAKWITKIFYPIMR